MALSHVNAWLVTDFWGLYCRYVQIKKALGSTKKVACSLKSCQKTKVVVEKNKFLIGDVAMDESRGRVNNTIGPSWGGKRKVVMGWPWSGDITAARLERVGHALIPLWRQTTNW